MNPDGDSVSTSTPEAATPVVVQPTPAPIVTDPVVVAATNLSSTLFDTTVTPDNAAQDIVDYQTKRLNDAIEGYNQAIPIKADFSALKAAQARAQALLEQLSATGGSILPRQSALDNISTVIINGYDISTYATDPLYEQKIRGILYALPPFSTPSELDTYIQTFFAGSPVTGVMVFAAANQYSVDIPLLVAIMQNDSGFGTLGIGAATFNPGNVGNTGSATHAYASWNDGVAAVANWLNGHRVAAPVTPDPLPAPLPEAPPTAPLMSTTTEPVANVATSTPPVFTTTETVASTTPSTATTTPATVDILNTETATTTATTTAPSIDMTTASTTPDVLTDTSATSTATSTDVISDTSSATSTATSTEP